VLVVQLSSIGSHSLTESLWATEVPKAKLVVAQIKVDFSVEHFPDVVADPAVEGQGVGF